MEVVEDFFIWLGKSSGSNTGPRRVVPISWYADSLDFGCFGPLFDAPGEELLLRFAPDTRGAFGLGDGLEVRGGLYWSDSCGRESLAWLEKMG